MKYFKSTDRYTYLTEKLYNYTELPTRGFKVSIPDVNATFTQRQLLTNFFKFGLYNQQIDKL